MAKTTSGRKSLFDFQFQACENLSWWEIMTANKMAAGAAAESACLELQTQSGEQTRSRQNTFTLKAPK